MALRFTCPHCGLVTEVSEQYLGQSGPCAQCGKTVTVLPPGPPPPNLGEDPVARMLIPVGRSGLAIAAGYAGLFAVLFFPAPIALVLGILAVRDIRKHPEKHGMGRALFGLISGIVCTTYLLLLLLSAVVVGFGSQ